MKLLRYHPDYLSVGIAGHSAADAAQLSAGADPCDVLDNMGVAVDYLHSSF